MRYEVLAEWAFEGNPNFKQALTVTITVTSMAYMFVYERVDFVKLSGTADFYSSQVYFYLGLFLLYGKLFECPVNKSPDGQDRPAAE